MNLFQLPENTPDGEYSETLIPDRGILIERIVSKKHASPPGFWYDQDQDEWVALLQGNAKVSWFDGHARDLNPGDWLFIPAHEKHRLEWTSADPPCIWLAVHGKLRNAEYFTSNF
jgi:cupin 2 domain-containing protein